MCPHDCDIDGGAVTDQKRCADCGCPLDEHHKLRCENETCPGVCNGWRCPDHGHLLCGCTYQGGPRP